MTGLTHQLAGLISQAPVSEIPSEAFRLAKTAILDGIGCAVAGTREPAGQIVARYVASEGSAPRAQVFGTSLRASAAMAALANGTAAHALDFDDTNHPMYGHPSCHLAPAVLALAEETGADGSRVLMSYLMGFETEVRLSRGLNLAHYDWGWHATGSLGTLGATAAAARLLGLDSEATARALGIAGSEAAGLRQNVGTMTKPFHAGRAALNGVMAARLAADGFGAAPDALEGPLGYCRVYGGGREPSWADITRDWCNPPEIVPPHGLALKPYPACGATHPSIDAAETIARENDLSPADIESVEVGVTALLPRILVYHSPELGIEGKFSLEYTVAAALTHRAVKIRHFTDENVQDQAIRALMKKISWHVAPHLADNSEFAAEVEVRLRDGRSFSHFVPLAKGKNARPMTDAERHDKFYDCAQPSLSKAQCDETIELVESLEKLPNVTRLAEVLAGQDRLRS